MYERQLIQLGVKKVYEPITVTAEEFRAIYLRQTEGIEEEDGVRRDRLGRRICRSYIRQKYIVDNKMERVPCSSLAQLGFKYCVVHRHRSGAGNGQFRHGRRSEVFRSTLMLSAYEHALADPEFSSVRDNSASLDARLADLHDRLTGASATLNWTQARKTYEKYLTYRVNPEREADAAQALERLGTILTAATSEEGTWLLIMEVMEQQRKLAETDAKNQERLHQTFTAEQALAVIQTMGQLAKEFVPGNRLPEYLSRLRLATMGMGMGKLGGG